MGFSSGNTLKNIEKECCAKIMIRGKGSVKEGKVGRKDGQMLPGEDEPLHALVTANTMENVKKAVEQVRLSHFFESVILLCVIPPLKTVLHIHWLLYTMCINGVKYVFRFATF